MCRPTTCYSLCKTLQVTSAYIFWVIHMILQLRQKIWVQHGQNFNYDVSIKALSQICDIFNQFRDILAQLTSNLFTGNVVIVLARMTLILLNCSVCPKSQHKVKCQDRQTYRADFIPWTPDTGGIKMGKMSK